MAEATMSMRLVYPFVKAVKSSGVDPKVMRFLEHADPDSRILASKAVDLLRLSVRITGDETLGLAAALETSPGDYGDMEYATGSCDTVGDALSFLSRFYFTLDGASTLHYGCEGGRVRVLLQQPSELHCRAGVDFALGMLYLGYVRWVGEAPREYEARFPYPEPPDLAPYRRLFGAGTRLSFAAPCSAVLFPQADLKRRLRYSDPKLHALLASYLHHRYTTRGLEPSMIDTVRTHILEELPRGTANLDRVATRLGMSPRSLTRKLDEEGTCFKRLLCDVRGALAVRYLLLDSCSISEISQQLGYSEPAAFHRAFRTWFGATPSAYRERSRRV